MTVIVPIRATLGFAAAVFALSPVIAARAQDASPWQRDGHSAVRLLAGSRSGAVLLGGIGFQLQPGWKTYWRTPGDSGVPPRFDFSKSENIEAVTVLWPAPMKFDDGAGGHSLGYHDQVVLPLRIVAKNADKPVTLRAAVNYAVCAKLCIPVDVAAPPEASEINLFVEGPTSEWSLPVPKLLEHSPPGVKRFSLELDGVPP